ncbi:hypothetical protein [Luedemannella helvata]|uniref:hypothetical protein n=1 Tax=Luedemannella helvata TaxID=349315 RepID=UPI0031D1AB21
MVDWSELRDSQGSPGDEVAALLNHVGQQPSAEAWKRLGDRLVVERECWCSAAYAALPRLSALAQSGTEENRKAAIELASMIAMTLHQRHADDDLVRADPSALATLFRLAASRLSTMAGSQLRSSLQAACAFAGYTFLAVISLDFSDEHYKIRCPVVGRTLDPAVLKALTYWPGIVHAERLAEVLRERAVAFVRDARLLGADGDQIVSAFAQALGRR